MGLGPKFDNVLDRIGLPPAEVEQRLRFLEWREADARNLHEFADQEDCHRQFTDHLYEHLGHFAPLAAILGDTAVLTRLKHSQTEYYRQLWSAPFDHAYVHDRLRIGLVHQHVGVDLKWYLGAYRLYLDHMLTELLGEQPQARVFASLLKRVFFDMSLP